LPWEIAMHVASQSSMSDRRRRQLSVAGWWVAGVLAVIGALVLWLAYADAVFLDRVLAALANCF
jgi:hypothetical protein